MSATRLSALFVLILCGTGLEAQQRTTVVLGFGGPHPAAALQVSHSIGSPVSLWAGVRKLGGLGGCDDSFPSFCPPSGTHVSGGFELALEDFGTFAPFVSEELAASRFSSGTWEGRWRPLFAGMLGIGVPVSPDLGLRLGLWGGRILGGQAAGFDFEGTSLANLVVELTASF